MILHSMRISGVTSKRPPATPVQGECQGPVTPGATPVQAKDWKKPRDGPGPNSLDKNLLNARSFEKMETEHADPSTVDTQPMETLEMNSLCRSLSAEFGAEAGLVGGTP